MKAVYVDSSVVVAVLLQQGNRAKFIEVLNDADEVVSSFFSEAEIYSVVKREGLDFEKTKTLLQSLTLVQSDGSLEKEIRDVLKAGYVRGADLHHLAVALYLDPGKKQLRFFTLDENQRKVAKAAGLEVV